MLSTLFLAVGITRLVHERAVVLDLVHKGEAPTARRADVQHYWLARRPNGELAARRGMHTPARVDGFRLGVARLPDAAASAPCTDHVERVGTRLLLSDASLNVWAFQLEPGEAHPYHVHRLPYLYVNVVESSTQELDAAGNAVGVLRTQRAHEASFVGSECLGGHGVRNGGCGEFVQFVIELKCAGLRVDG